MDAIIDWTLISTADASAIQTIRPALTVHHTRIHGTPILDQNLPHRVPEQIGQTVIASAEPEGQTIVIRPHAVHGSGEQVV
jgi:hypothetical protein